MRQSLENIKFIEDFILGNFDPSEHERAKQRIDGSPELSHLLETQQCIYSATKRKALRSEIQAYAPTATPSIFEQYKYWFIGGLAALTILIGFFIFNSNGSLEKQQSSTSFQSQVSKNEDDVKPWIPFDVQTFSFIAEKGTTILGQDGTLIILGKNSLLDVDGNQVSGKVEAELIEALDWEDMIAYNLTTTSDGKALSSGGMMRIRYKQNGKEVFVDPKQPMHIEIPTDDYKSEMKIWEGEVKNDHLNWKNPQEIERFLSKIDLNYLNFIPAGFDNEVAALLPYNNHNQISDRLVDSLYYSISANREMYALDRQSKNSFVNDCYFAIPRREDIINGHPRDQTKPLMKGQNSVTAQIVDPEGKPIAGVDVKLRMDRYLEHDEVIKTDDDGKFTFNKFYPGKVVVYASLHSADSADVLWKYCLKTSFTCPKTPKHYTLKEPLVAECSSMINFNKLSVSPKTGGCFIDPLAIKTLKGSRFQNTFIATKEFETRLQAMHLFKNGSLLLETYMKNLSEPLWKCDQMAVNLLSGTEKQIFQNFADQKLTNVQNNGIHQEALLKYYTEQRKAYHSEKRKHYVKNRQKTSAEILELHRSLETVLNKPSELAAMQVELKGRSTLRSGTIQRSSRENSRVTPGTSYKFSWFSSSWVNIDMYMKLLGPAPWVTAINTDYDEESVNVFQCLRQTKTVIGLSKRSGSFEAKFPKNGEQEETFSLAMLMNGAKLMFASQSYFPSEVRDINLKLAPISQEDFYLELCALAPEESSIAKRLRTEQKVLQSQASINQSIQPLARELEAARNDISAEVIIYNHLFDFLSRCSKSIVQ